MSSGKKIVLGMIILAISGLLFGGALGYIGTHYLLANKVLNEMISEGYVLTDDATATSEDIVSGASAYVGGQLVQGTVETFDTSDATATSDVIVKGKTAYVNGEIVVGTMPVYNGGEVKPSTVAFTISGGQYLADDIVIEGSKYLKPENIRKGISIFKVSGTYVPNAQPQPEGGQ